MLNHGKMAWDVCPVGIGSPGVGMTFKAGTSSQLDSYVDLEGPRFSIQSLVCCSGIFMNRVMVEENLAKEKPKLACLVPHPP